MNFATSTRPCKADRPLVCHQHDHRYRRRLGGSCCAAAVAVALSIPSTAVTSTTAASATAVTSTTDASTTVASTTVSATTIRATTIPSRPASSSSARPTVHALAATSKSVHTRRVCVAVANVRSGPGVSHRVVTTLRRGTVVRGTTTRGWLRIRAGRWISLSVTCRSGSGSSAAQSKLGGGDAFRSWARAIDPAGNASWTIDRSGVHTRGNVRGLTVFRSAGPARSTVYIQPGMTWSKTKLVMAHEAIHVRQIRYGGFTHSLGVFGSISGMERAADCGASIILGRQVGAGCSTGTAKRVRNLLAGRPA
jgi:hypothetical protein